MEREDEKGVWVEGGDMVVEVLFGGDFDDLRHGGRDGGGKVVDYAGVDRCSVSSV